MKEWSPEEGTSKLLLAASVLILGVSLLNITGERFSKYQEFGNGSITVIDGDTVKFSGKNFSGTVRLLGVDAPETQGSSTPEEFEGVPDTVKGRRCLKKWGRQAKRFLEKRTEGKRFTVETDPLADKRGEYGRVLAYLSRMGLNRSVNQMLVEKGYSRVYTSSFTRKELFLELEKEAMRHRRGLWKCRDL